MRKKLCSAAVCCLMLFLTACRTGQVQFECGVSGFASQTSYNGFYYSSGDVPLGFGGTGDMTLAPSGAGWCWEETEGDNWYYTERLRSGWYYYEMHF